MKSRSIKIALLSAFALKTALLTFAAGQPAKVRTLSKAEMQDRTGVTRAVQQGKGGGIFYNQVALRGNAYRSRTTAEDSRAIRNESGTTHQKWGDPAFRR